jgi:hypothetical protein
VLSGACGLMDGYVVSLTCAGCVGAGCGGVGEGWAGAEEEAGGDVGAELGDGAGFVGALEAAGEGGGAVPDG